MVRGCFHTLNHAVAWIDCKHGIDGFMMPKLELKSFHLSLRCLRCGVEGVEGVEANVGVVLRVGGQFIAGYFLDLSMLRQHYKGLFGGGQHSGNTAKDLFIVSWTG